MKQKMKSAFILIPFSAILLASCGGNSEPQEVIPAEDSTKVILSYENEKHLANVRQLTFGGDNAEAYWSFDDASLVLQITNPNWNIPCDQIYLMNATAERDSMPLPMLSNGKGRTTCAYFMPDDKSVLYASTHHVSEECPEVPERGEKYVWALYDSFDIFVADLQGNVTAQLTKEPGYDAEATVSPKGDKIVFTSTRSGDVELYTMNIDGSGIKQITNELGYDGGAFFSPDGTRIVFRASRPTTPEAVKEYKDLLKEGLVQPVDMEVFVCNSDGSDVQQVTNLGKANWCPYFHPSGEKIIFASNHSSEKGFPFNLYMINIDGTGLEQITSDPTFDAFPMFSNDGKKMVWGSNRFNGGTRETNIFVADWVE